jgi:hypothetical protein
VLNEKMSSSSPELGATRPEGISFLLNTVLLDAEGPREILEGNQAFNFVCGEAENNRSSTIRMILF